MDECAANTDNCEQVCINQAGSFKCGCNDGYKLKANGFQCEGILACVCLSVFFCVCVNAHTHTVHTLVQYT